MNAVFFAALCLIWGSTWMAIKINLGSFPPFFSAGLRFLLAGFVLLAAMKFAKVSFPGEWRKLSPSFVFGLLNGISYGLIYWGEQYIPSGLTAVLNASLPFFSIIFAAMFIGERITLRKVFGSIIGFAGVLLLFYESLSELSSGKIMGEIAIVVAAAVYALAGVHVKKRSSVEPLAAVTVQMLTAAAVLLLVALPVEYGAAVHFTWRGLVAFMYLSLFGSAVAFYLYNHLILRMEVTALSYTSLITPAIATLLGVLIMEEELNGFMIIGMILIFTGTAIINIKGAHRSRDKLPDLSADSEPYRQSEELRQS
ncbi:DMT family transporter [Thermincola potens]|uniref:EamA domain-containing protein n=1 Tax=Thermincola potens (strain JR) TaxID=635013 RepID=D5XAC8_THEPJ|nr:EamA family transporter [Thermincola potens]ADG81227.1 protein of unknown function DUF6 transmembrane [Thermincola potens JR]